MKTVWEYKQILKEKGINMTDEEIQVLVERIDNLGKLIFKKYKNTLFTNFSDYE